MNIRTMHDVISDDNDSATTTTPPPPIRIIAFSFSQICIGIQKNIFRSNILSLDGTIMVIPQGLNL